jgi:hypothetical protein
VRESRFVLAVIFHIYYRAAGDFARRGSIEKPPARRRRHKVHSKRHGMPCPYSVPGTHNLGGRKVKPRTRYPNPILARVNAPVRLTS